MTDLKEFDMTKIIKKPRANIIVIGKRNSGKSTLVKDILSRVSQSVPLFIAMSRTEPTNHFYRDMMPDVCVFDDVNLGKFADIKERQKGLIKLAQSGKNRKYRGINTNIGLVLDDCIDDTEWTKDNNVKFFTANGRWLHLMFIIATQFAKALTPPMRANADYIFISQMNNFDELRKIRNEFMGMIKHKQDFDYIFKTYTSNWKYIVIDNVTQDPGLQNKIFWYKAPDPDVKPKLCDPCYWDLNNIISDKIYRKLIKKEQQRNTLYSPDNNDNDEERER